MITQRRSHTTEQQKLHYANVPPFLASNLLLLHPTVKIACHNLVLKNISEIVFIALEQSCPRSPNSQSGIEFVYDSSTHRIDLLSY